MRIWWVLALSPEDRAACVRDLTAAALRGQLGRELTSWRETARCMALGLDSAELEWLNPAGNNAVGRP